MPVATGRQRRHRQRGDEGSVAAQNVYRIEKESIHSRCCSRLRTALVAAGACFHVSCVRRPNREDRNGRGRQERAQQKLVRLESEHLRQFVLFAGFKVCTRCWHAHSKILNKWERASESPASFQRPLGSVIRDVPVPSADSLHSEVVFTQTYAKKTFAERVSFWCVDNESLLSGLRAYCGTNHLTFSAETDRRMPGQVYVKIQ
jgi:hypothetical protein